ncbi:MAG: hypothetical protein COW76_18805 [Shewanella sp. CG18_big_fil_WC_8_21_14_2_50_42_11]|uniref:hypothetical protein n=1 Tax=Shewanella sp. CG18_big_fil_WC_8_21_14_2_50_42_11 TaxID=1975538 RepID=UPI000C4A487C|nr:hypothetical protein [Shewanella sp. CG18_big_fil_WC_8_21_14_2_50_42_11]PIP98857.1 MAG: hypothetical protein COW76_18805 [Shewanella sp. CG18_big_fil_WC_8_21_14_2_50_42_11]
MAQYQSVQLPPRLPLTVMTGNRNTSVDKDARLVNCYAEIDKAEVISIFKRPGMELALTPPGAASPGRGVFFWNGNVISIFGDKLYADGLQVATGLDTTIGGTNTPFGGVYSFSSILGATPKIVMHNGIGAYAWDGINPLSASLHTLDPDYPIETVKGWAYLSGAQYVMQPASVIWGSRPNSVTAADSWDPLNFISANDEPDNGVAIVKQLVYVVAMNQWSTEILFDAGNPVGSPLGKVQGSKLDYGCVHADSVQKIDDKTVWLTISRGSSPQIGLLQGLTFNIVSTPAIDRLLRGVDMARIMSWQAKIVGHTFYVITFPLSNLTLVYDIELDHWAQWTDDAGNYVPIIASTFDNARNVILQHESNGTLLKFSIDAFTDVGKAIQVDIITPVFDAQTRRRKQLNRMEFVSDQELGSTLQVRNSDDDYQSWTPWRRVDLGAKRPHLINCGTFNKRAYHFRHRQNLPFRIYAIELQYDIGVL